MFGLQPTDIIAILLVALLVFGPSRLPQIGRALGSTMKEFQNTAREVTSGFQDEVKTTPVKTEEPVTATVPCKNCSKPIEPGMRFCPECGASQVDAPQPNASQTDMPQSSVSQADVSQSDAPPA